MSFDIFGCRFENGELTQMDMSAAYEVLDPYGVARDPRSNFLQIRTADGEEAGVFFSGPDNITFNRIGGGGIMDLLAVLLRRAVARMSERLIAGRPNMVVSVRRRRVVSVVVKTTAVALVS
ncbi:hypothetical protein [Streptomyces sp. adm13(2018)]|uniref:hypothetical protein n=1 Tax=Streptomyces sp. adm13(2018) TaxID=2479007 RepID=UPI0016509E6D|nr:hypothetical protein [Streptomyces sp. adm13(2018)]